MMDNFIEDEFLKSFNGKLRSEVIAKLNPRNISRGKKVGTHGQEYVQIYSMLENTFKLREGKSIIIIGPRGVGKTLLVENALHDLETVKRYTFFTVRLNGSFFKDDTVAIKEIARQLDWYLEKYNPSQRENLQRATFEQKTVTNTMNVIIDILDRTRLKETDENIDLKDKKNGPRETKPSLFVPIVFVIDEIDRYTHTAKQTLLYNLFDMAQSSSTRKGEGRGNKFTGGTTISVVGIKLEPFSSSDEADEDSRRRDEGESSGSKDKPRKEGSPQYHTLVEETISEYESITVTPPQSEAVIPPSDSASSHPPTAQRTHSFLSEKGPKVHSYQIADLEEVPHGIQRQSKSLEDYSFPTHRLKPQMTTSNKFPLVIVACGSFSPITYLHLRMFEMALDAIREQTRFEVMGAYFSPVSDNYRKPGLAPAHHRVRMCELACERTSSWLMVDAWENLQPKYTRTALVLDHFNEEINIKRNGVLSKNGDSRLGVKIMLLAGGDLIESMGEPNVWAEQDLHHILGNYGCLIVERTGSDVRSFLLSHDIMYEHRKNILVIKQLIYNDISSTKVRLFLRRNMSVQYLLPNSVIRYIQEHGLYVDEKEPVKLVLNK
ncbi:hypothetical protein PMKS-003292 [Pichia membranifaciens]|uniref:Uncharacterized protein n=1 Tax=Pichia membranifaciens TaxID=4926 RepID=A0A1Q2YJS0_9ASCO|nr:hypothetical protein PMKS-003292 [Pichia membranifaciens]